jgi:hypothetical protein
VFPFSTLVNLVVAPESYKKMEVKDVFPQDPWPTIATFLTFSGA